MLGRATVQSTTGLSMAVFGGEERNILSRRGKERTDRERIFFVNCKIFTSGCVEGKEGQIVREEHGVHAAVNKHGIRALENRKCFFRAAGIRFDWILLASRGIGILFVLNEVCDWLVFEC